MSAPTLRSHHVDAGGLRLRVLEAGEGPPVLFVHGWPTNAQLWRHALPRVAARGRRAIAVDLPGFGQSDKPLDVRYSLPFFAGALDGALEALGVEQTGLCVHDLGGPVGLYWAVHQPERITDLCLLNTLVYAELHWAVTAFLLGARLPGVRSLATSKRGLQLALAAGVARTRWMAEDHHYTEPAATAEGRRALQLAAVGISPRRLARIGPKLAGFADIPVRVVYGEVDRALPDVAQTMARVKRDLPQAEVSALPGVGHFLQEDAPDEVADALAAFFGR